MTDRADDLQSLVSGATLVVIGGVVASISKLVERIIIGRTLPPDIYGEVNIGIIIMTFATTIALFGYSHATTRYVSQFDDERDIRGVWVSSLLVPGLLGFLITGVLLWHHDLVLHWLFDDPDAGFYLLLFIVTVPFRTLFRISIHALRGFEKASYKAGVNDLLFPGVRIGIVVALFWLGYGPEAVGYAYVISTVFVLVVAHVLLNRLVPLVGRFRLHSRKMTVFAAPLILSTILAFLLVQTDTLLLGVFRTSHEVGLYAAAVPIATGLLIVLKSFGFMYLPIASRLDADGNQREIDAIYSTTTKWVYVVSFPAFAAFVCFPRDVIEIIFGPEYVIAAGAFVILIVEKVPQAANLVLDKGIQAFDRPKYGAIATVVSLSMNVALNLALVPRLGLEGAALATLISVVVNTAILAYYFRRLLVVRFPVADVAWCTLAALVMGAALVAVTRVLVVDTAVGLIAVVAVSAAVYGAGVLASPSLREKVLGGVRGAMG